MTLGQRIVNAWAHDWSRTLGIEEEADLVRRINEAALSLGADVSKGWLDAVLRRRV